MTLRMSDDELRTMIEAVRDGTATPEQHRELELLLRQDANARRYYVQYQLLCADLQAILPAHDRDEPAAAPAAEDGCHREGFGTGRATDRMRPERRRKGAKTQAEGPTPAGTAAGASRRRWAWRIGAAAAVLLMLALGSPWLWRLRGTRPVPAAGQDATLATLVAAMDAQWGRDAGLAIGSQLPAMPLELKRGLAEIRFASGAAVILQGPVECVLESPSHLTLRRGRISAKVPVEAIGFTVRTDQATVVDLGTEFAVSSAGNGATDVHVFRGQVALGTSFGRQPDRQLLGAGAARRVEVDGSRVESIRSDELAFVRPREFEARIKALDNSPYHRWLAASYQLRREPALVLYYTWDGAVDDPQRAINGAGATAGKLDGLLGNGRDPDTCPQWVSPGRWPQQRALRFDASRRQHLRVPHSNELNITQALTIAAWIRPNTALLQATGAIATKRTVSGDTAQPNYELALIREQDERGEVQCGLCFRSGSRRVASAGMPVVPGRWMHVAAVANGGQCVLYVDGRRVATGDSADFVPNEGDLWIGTIPGDPRAGGANDNESFEGLISELLLVRRMLSETEIHAMWSAGKPEP